MIEHGSREDIIASLAALRAEIGCDFGAVGMTEAPLRVLRWQVASGHANERYAGIAEKPGRGLSATVLKVGRPISLSMTELVCSRRLQEFPLLLAEDLRSAYAVPLYLGTSLAGVLIAGDRRKRIYRTEERRIVAAAGDRIAALLTGLSAAGSMQGG
ncbi:GAF domain-containing protein [Cohnella sp. JJ-181]|uniref:GAF domain-containing protein n=1 Tax=Cohnella rhizoplanae TaxID=2974897 RepID=UPI0022FFB86B|nr:GAF domain-containing protein [Cohnella sp. JJ-181]CAI6035461.1 hypothetical protein COHCIP112018_00875 [Cohnella sp. JJ-181]